MPRRVPPSELQRIARELERKKRQAIDTYNQEVRRYNENVRRAVESYNREARAHNDRVRANRQRLQSALVSLSLQQSPRVEPRLGSSFTGKACLRRLLKSSWSRTCQDMQNIVDLFRIFNDGTHGSAGTFDMQMLSVIRKRVEDGIFFLPSRLID